MHIHNERTACTNGEIANAVYHDHIRNAIQNAQYLEFENMANCALKIELLITAKEWRSETLPIWLREEGKRLLGGIALDAQLSTIKANPAQFC